MKISGLSSAQTTSNKWAVTIIASLAIFGGIGAGQSVIAKESPSIGVVALTELPQEAQVTEQAIRSGGPFPYRKDGDVFGNRERLLPSHPRGYYREYTVKTPGSRDRGARRIVCGGQEAKHPDACFYSDDHYASFRRIRSD